MNGRLLAIGLLVALGAARSALAAPGVTSVQRDEILESAGAVDTFEVICKGAAELLCVTSEDRGTLDDPMFLSLVGISPAIMVGASDVVEVSAGNIDGICLTRRGSVANMKALATFTARKDAIFPATYSMVASCLDDIGRALRVKVRVKQQETQH